MVHRNTTMETRWAVFHSLAMLICVQMNAAQLQDTSMDVKEYCENEFFFKPKCEDNTVIVLKYARYGRMHDGRCISGAKDSLGCSMDARDILGGKCSGRRSCEVYIASIPLMNNYPCDVEMRGYLEASFECVNVIYPPRGYCRTGEVTEIQEERGYLSNVVAEETGCGSSQSPWWILAKPGEQLRFQLQLFSSEINNGHQGVKVYAVLDEESARTSQPLTNKALEFTTIGNRVKLTIMTGEVDGQSMANILIRFEAIGCADVTPPDNGWSQRVADKVHMGCNVSDLHEPKAEWTMHCVDNKWTGNTQTCAAIQGANHLPKVAAAEENTEWSLLTESNALFIAAGLGLAILIGLCLLVLGLVYICRMKRRIRCPPDRPVTNGTRTRLHQKECSRVKEQFLTVQEEEDEYYCPPESGYQRDWNRAPDRHGRCHPKHGPSACDMPLPPPPYSPSRPLSTASTNRWSRGGAEHVYERPTFVIPPSDQAAEGDTHSMSTSYYQADQPCAECDHTNTL